MNNPVSTPKPLSIGPVLVHPPVLMAPMAGFTTYAFRQIVRQLGGCGLAATEMISARGFREMELRKGAAPERLWGVADEPRPLAVQIWDNDPQTLAAIGQCLAREYHVSVVDINFGCPARDIAAKAESGSYLLRYPERIGELVQVVVAACRPVPVTAKIRLGLTRDTINAVDVAQAVESAGGAAITVHGRTAADFYRGTADWEEIARVKHHLRSLPLVGNGDLTAPREVVEAFRRYGVQGVMVGRAAISQPWFFRQAAAALAGDPIPPAPTDSQQRELLLEHFNLLAAQHGSEQAIGSMRRFAACYVRARSGARVFRSRLSGARSMEDFVSLVDQLFGAP